MSLLKDIEQFPALTALPGLVHGFTLRIPGIDCRVDREAALERLFAAHGEIRRALGLDIAVAVNLSARQAARADLARTVLDVLEQSQLPSTALSLELTETALLEATSDTLQQLELLRSAGIEIGIDDFGTGYASLCYLASLPVSFVKIDRSFTSGLPHDPTALVIVDAVARLASDLGLRCVAEGVETAEQSQWYGRYPGMLVQGYLHGRPTDADHVLPYLSVA